VVGIGGGGGLGGGGIRLACKGRMMKMLALKSEYLQRAKLASTP
jgi:hypothetical protein